MSNIELDDQLFNTSKNDLNKVVTKMDNIIKNLEKLQNIVDAKFNTAAGKAMKNLYNDNLLKSFYEQREVIIQIQDNLDIAINYYQSVFDKYKKLNK